MKEVSQMTVDEFEQYGMFEGFRHFTKDDVGWVPTKLGILMYSGG